MFNYHPVGFGVLIAVYLVSIFTGNAVALAIVSVGYCLITAIYKTKDATQQKTQDS